MNSSQLAKGREGERSGDAMSQATVQVAPGEYPGHDVILHPMDGGMPAREAVAFASEFDQRVQHRR